MNRETENDFENFATFLNKRGQFYKQIVKFNDMNDIVKSGEDYAKIKMIEENKSLLEMTKLHMDIRTVLVISNRISELEK